MHSGQVEVAEDAEATQLREQSNLLELEEGVDVEDIVLRDELEAVEGLTVRLEAEDSERDDSVIIPNAALNSGLQTSKAVKL